MNLKKFYIEEDMFPKLFTSFEEKYYGILFYNEENKSSYDSNHAVIYKDKIYNLNKVLEDIKKFYKKKGINPIIYQSMLDNGYFTEIKNELTAAGFKSWDEEQKYMLRLEDNKIIPNEKIRVVKETEWNENFTQVFLEAEEPWEIQVLKKSIENPKAWLFVAYIEEKPIGVLYGHLSDDDICRVDYLLISKKYRRIGAGKTLFHNYVKWIKEQKIKNAYIWPDGDIPEKIYFAGGFRVVEHRHAGRAVLV